MAREVLKATCKLCEKDHPRTLFAEKDICIFCKQAQQDKADAILRQNDEVRDEDRRKHQQKEAREALRAEMVDLEREKLKREAKNAETEADFDPQKAAQRELARILLARKRLLPFVQRMAPDYKAGWVHKDICEHLEWFSEAVAAGQSPRLAIFMPPRHGKSALATINFPAWHLGRNPQHEFISCSYSGALALKFSRKARALVREKSYRQVFETFGLDQDSQSAEEWLTDQGGGYRAAGVGGPITGTGAHILCIDDPVKNREEAESDTTRESVWDWYTSTAYTRLAPGGGVLLILTRWHDDDLAGRLMTAMANDEGDEWRVVNYPAIAETDELYRQAGESLHEGRYPLEALLKIKRAIGPRDWSALYQQNPVPDEGAFFTKGMFQFYKQKELPPWDEMIFYTAWDLAVGQKEMNDWSVGITVGVDRQDNLYVVDIQRGRWDSLAIVDKMLETYQTWRPSMTGIERGQIELAIGPLLMKTARERSIHGFGYEPLKPGRNDKVARAQSIKGRMQQGRVQFRSGCDITQSLVNEMLRFPAGTHDDGVDAMAYIGKLLDQFAVPRAPKAKPKKSWKDRLPLSARSSRPGWKAA